MDYDEAKRIVNGEAREFMARAAEKWQGDTANDRVARAIIGSMTVIIDGFETNVADVNPFLGILLVEHYMNTSRVVAQLESLAKLRDQ